MFRECSYGECHVSRLYCVSKRTCHVLRGGQTKNIFVESCHYYTSRIMTFNSLKFSIKLHGCCLEATFMYVRRSPLLLFLNIIIRHPLAHLFLLKRNTLIRIMQICFCDYTKFEGKHVRKCFVCYRLFLLCFFNISCKQTSNGTWETSADPPQSQ